MDNFRKSFPEIIKRQEVKDYTYAILFFIVSSFFALFIIKPVLKIAIELEKERTELSKINKIHTDNIAKIISIQTDLESIRNKKNLVEDALPKNPALSIIIDDIRKAAAAQDITLTSLKIKELNIKGGTSLMTETQKIQVDIEATTDFARVNKFVSAILSQRRVKAIKDLKISKNEKLEGSNNLNIELLLEVYYLPVAEVDNRL